MPCPYTRCRFLSCIQRSREANFDSSSGMPCPYDCGITLPHGRRRACRLLLLRAAC
jgi:hypothetical protein